MNRSPRLILFVSFIEPSAHCPKVLYANRSKHDKIVLRSTTTNQVNAYENTKADIPWRDARELDEGCFFGTT